MNEEQGPWTAQEQVCEDWQNKWLALSSHSARVERELGEEVKAWRGVASSFEARVHTLEADLQRTQRELEDSQRLNRELADGDTISTIARLERELAGAKGRCTCGPWWHQEFGSAVHRHDCLQSMLPWKARAERAEEQLQQARTAGEALAAFVSGEVTVPGSLSDFFAYGHRLAREFRAAALQSLTGRQEG